MKIRIPFEQYMELKEALKKVGIRTRFSIRHGSDNTVEGLQFDNPYKTAVAWRGTEQMTSLIETLTKAEF